MSRTDEIDADLPRQAPYAAVAAVPPLRPRTTAQYPHCADCRDGQDGFCPRYYCCPFHSWR